MKNCPKCGSFLEESEHFCKHCGEVFEIAESKDENKGESIKNNEEKNLKEEISFEEIVNRKSKKEKIKIEKTKRTIKKLLLIRTIISAVISILLIGLIIFIKTPRGQQAIIDASKKYEPLANFLNQTEKIVIDNSEFNDKYIFGTLQQKVMDESTYQFDDEGKLVEYGYKKSGLCLELNNDETFSLYKDFTDKTNYKKGTYKIFYCEDEETLKYFEGRDITQEEIEGVFLIRLSVNEIHEKINISKNEIENLINNENAITDDLNNIIIDNEVSEDIENIINQNDNNVETIIVKENEIDSNEEITIDFLCEAMIDKDDNDVIYAVNMNDYTEYHLYKE